MVEGGELQVAGAPGGQGGPGPGVRRRDGSSRDLPHIFEPVLLDQIGGERHRAGPGPPIVQEHGGDIDVRARRAGTTFTITLPAGDGLTAPHPRRRRRKEHARVLSIMLKKEGYDVPSWPTAALGAGRPSTRTGGPRMHRRPHADDGRSVGAKSREGPSPTRSSLSSPPFASTEPPSRP